MTKQDLQQFRSSVSDELHHHLIPFWTEKVTDTQHGGFIGHMTNDGTIDPQATKGLILNTRLLWTFSALSHFTSEPRIQTLARCAYDYVMTYFWDQQHGGFYWQVDFKGQPLDTGKRIYGQAFAVYALSEYARCFSFQEAEERAIELFNLISQHALDSVYGGYVEVCTRSWDIVHDARLSDKDLPEIKSMNNHLHLLEAATSLYRLRSGPQVRDALAVLLTLFAEKIMDKETGHLGHFFAETWEPRSENYTFGHDIEASWLLHEAVETLGGNTLKHTFEDMALRLAQVTLAEGLDPEGGLFYEGRHGQVTDDNKEWWPQAEAVVGFLNAYQLSGDAAFIIAARQIWHFILSNMVDRDYGDWFWRVDRSGRPDFTEPKVSQWKGPYHSIRACLETLDRLQTIMALDNLGDQTIETGSRF